MLHANVSSSGVARGSRMGEALSLILFGASMVMVLATVYVLVGRAPKMATAIVAVEVDLLSLAPADTPIVIMVSLDEIEKESAWMSMLRENLETTERVRTILDALELSVEDFSQIALFGRDNRDIVAIRLKPGRSIDQARLLTIPDAKPEQLGDRVWTRLKDGQIHSFDGTTLLATRRESTMREMLGRKFSGGPSHSIKEMFKQTEPAAVRVVRDDKSTNSLLSQLGWVLRGHMPDLLDDNLKGMSVSFHLTGDRAEMRTSIHHKNRAAAITSAKDLDRIVKSWRPDIPQLIKAAGWANRHYSPMLDDLLSTSTTSVDDYRMTIHSRFGMMNARSAVVDTASYLQTFYNRP